MSELLKEYVESILIEMATLSAQDVGDSIVAAGTKTRLPPLEVKKASNNEIRIAPSGESYAFTEEEIASILIKAGLKIVKVIPKKAPGSVSDTFSTFIVKKGVATYPVVFTKGRNKGQQFEDQLSREAQDLKTGVVSPTIASLLDAIGINPKNIQDSEQTGGKNNARPLLSTIPNVGSIISDLTLILKREDKSANTKDGKIIYISLKDPGGSTFANTGYTGGFKLGKDRNGEPAVLPGSHPTDDFLLALGVNKRLAAKGFTNVLRESPVPVAPTPKRYSKKDPVVEAEPEEQQDYEKVQTYLASAYGIGYWYARDMGGGNWHVKKIVTKKDALGLVGDIKRIDISYPGVTKQITCSILTTKGRYIVEVRHAHSGVVPNQVNVKVG